MNFSALLGPLMVPGGFVLAGLAYYAVVRMLLKTGGKWWCLVFLFDLAGLTSSLSHVYRLVNPDTGFIYKMTIPSAVVVDAYYVTPLLVIGVAVGTYYFDRLSPKSRKPVDF